MPNFSEAIAGIFRLPYRATHSLLSDIGTGLAHAGFEKYRCHIRSDHRCRRSGIKLLKLNSDSLILLRPVWIQTAMHPSRIEAANKPQTSSHIRHNRSICFYLPTGQRFQASGQSSTRGGLDLVIENEVFGHVGAPNIERIFDRVIGSWPTRTWFDIVNVIGVLRVAVPRITDICKVVGTKDMTPDTPPASVARAFHLRHASADIIQAANAPTAMVQTAAIRLRQSDQVMITAVRRMHESDHIPRSIGQTKSQHVFVELEAMRDIRGEQKNVGQIQRPHWANFAARRGPPRVRTGGWGSLRRRVVG